MIELEICVDSIESAKAAVKGGASRIELCSALSEGGLTPSIGTLITLKRDLKLRIPIFCMLRPRKGNDFLYSENDMKAVLHDLEMLSLYGADGFVFGALDLNGKVNVQQCKDVISKAGTFPVTFHRAFDLTSKSEMHETCQLIEGLGFNRILTSGFEQTAELGIKNIKELIASHPGITIMPGSGISSENVLKLLTETRCKEFHASARCKKIYSMLPSSDVSLGDQTCNEVFVTDTNIVRELVEIAVDVSDEKTSR